MNLGEYFGLVVYLVGAIVGQGAGIAYTIDRKYREEDALFAVGCSGVFWPFMLLGFMGSILYSAFSKDE